MSVLRFNILLLSILSATLTFSQLTLAKKSTPAVAKQDVALEPKVEMQPAALIKEIKFSLTSVVGTEVFEETPLMQSRDLLGDETPTSLKSVSHGLRKKAIFGLVPVRVYVAQLFAAHPEKLIKTESGILSSLKAAGPIQLRLVFLRDIPGQKIADSFKEGLEANKINTKKLSAELNKVMTLVTEISEFKKTDAFSITGVWKNNESFLLLEDSKSIKVVPGSGEFLEQIFSMWLGKPADAKLADLKKDLLR